MQNRIYSKTLWVAIFALILFVSKTYFGYEVPEGDKLVDLILLIMTLAGILKNPTDSTKF